MNTNTYDSYRILEILWSASTVISFLFFLCNELLQIFESELITFSTYCLTVCRLRRLFCLCWSLSDAGAEFAADGRRNLLLGILWDLMSDCRDADRGSLDWHTSLEYLVTNCKPGPSHTSLIPYDRSQLHCYLYDSFKRLAKYWQWCNLLSA